MSRAEQTWTLANDTITECHLEIDVAALVPVIIRLDLPDHGRPPSTDPRLLALGLHNIWVHPL